MKTVIRILLVTGLLGSSLPAFAQSDIGNIVKAQIIIGKVMQVVDAYREFTVELEAPEPIAGNQGKLLLPYRADGEITAWAEKALNAQAGKLAGEQAGNVASKAIASKIPFGGLAAGALKKKSKEVGAVTALGGMKFIKANSDISFNNLDDYCVYLHVRHAGDPNYKEALSAAMAVYPDLETHFDVAIKNAYRTQAGR
jgi:hypothetical protein